MFVSGVLFMLGCIAAGFAVRVLVGAWERGGGGPQLDFEAAARDVRFRELQQYLAKRKPLRVERATPQIERAVRWIALSVIAVVIFCGPVGLLSH